MRYYSIDVATKTDPNLKEQGKSKCLEIKYIYYLYKLKIVKVHTPLLHIHVVNEFI